MSKPILIRHLLNQDVIVVDGRKPTAAYPRYNGRLSWDKDRRRYAVGVYGMDLLTFRLAQVVKVEGKTITLGRVEDGSYSQKRVLSSRGTTESITKGEVK